jgi:DNA gyrase/topoisomerase IV subunit B
MNKARSRCIDKVIAFSTEKDQVTVEIAMQWNDGYDEKTSHLRQQHQHARGRLAHVWLPWRAHALA